MTAYYLESHITIEPVFEEQLEKAKEIAGRYDFKVAHLLMQKRSEDTPERSKYDTFMTGHGKEYLVMAQRTKACIRELQSEGFKVWRYKIEDTICDSRILDVFDLGVGK